MTPFWGEAPLILPSTITNYNVNVNVNVLPSDAWSKSSLVVGRLYC